MSVCIICYFLLAVLWVLRKRKWLERISKKMFLILLVCNTIALGIFIVELFHNEQEVKRNTYGEGSKTESYEVTIPEAGITDDVEVEVFEQEYSVEETQELFREVMKELDGVILGKNESFDRVEKDLNLVGNLPDYPVEIVWELDSYNVMNVDGKIRSEHVTDEGTLVEIRGTLTYLSEQAFYVRHAMVYPLTREGVDKILYEIKLALQERELATRQDESFSLPDEVAGMEIQWSQKSEGHGYYVILIGIVLVIFQLYREKEEQDKKRVVRENALRREYPAMVSKLTMLLSTGMTVKHAWEKIVESYEKYKEQLGENVLYEEMLITLHEMKGGIPEGEAYERFGKRCEIPIYLKFGALLSQNLRKGSRGLSDLLRMEAIQSFENRKSQAKQEGEEAGTKLLLPMMGMLAVVLIMVMIPAFLTMQ